jgi:hypothetical protein
MKTTAVIIGVGLGLAVPLVRKAARPLGFYALAGGMIAYEAACEAIENSGFKISRSFKNVTAKLRRAVARNSAGESRHTSC